ncbi:putative Concanavalin A-like lectin protein kinase family protein [Hibiscus syriacus]|uniref:Concanavalin A-like lectin protein kinase family protein n=1 Tax=Hibiscus syriacus TaxID=106335 RepID=A0A6A3CD24_HIBSY|nr:putative Concanavalin A-like lectin protein kinase family protein [Hibiscus syriacus]
MEKQKLFKQYSQEPDSRHPWNADFGFNSATDRRYAFSRQHSFKQPIRDLQTPNFSNDSTKPFLSRNVSSIDIPQGFTLLTMSRKEFSKPKDRNWRINDRFCGFFRVMRTGNRQMKRLLIMISLNVAYSTAELAIGLFTGRVGLKYPLSRELATVLLAAYSISIMDGKRLERVQKRISDRKIQLRVTDAAVQLLGSLGYDPNYGARPVRRVIQQNVENELAKGILRGEFKYEDTTAEASLQETRW